MIDLSILICSVSSRVDTFLPKLIKFLEPQLNDNVELLVSLDNKRRTVGEKRNDLVNQSQGKYVCFIDDDDMIEYDYVSEITNAIKESNGVDCICFGANRYVDGVFDKPVKYGQQYREDKNTNDCYFRLPNHLMVFRRDLALTVPFPYQSFGEDALFAMAMKYKIKSQYTIDKVLYHYYFSEKTTETQKK